MGNPAPTNEPAVDSRDLTLLAERADDAMRAYATALLAWNAPDAEHTRYQLRHLVEDVISDLTVGASELGEPISWKNVLPGDTISLTIHSRYGYEREQRRVVDVNWPTIMLAEGGRGYEIDATDPDRFDRRLRLVSRSAS